MNTIIWIAIAYLSGALPFSVWLGKILKSADVRQVGDGNPGATNALKLGGWQLGLLVLILDVAKGAVPVGITYQILGFRGTEMVMIAIAPLLGHGFSPFLKFRGGKGLAVTLGIWIGLTIISVPWVALLSLTFFYLFISVDGWSVFFTILVLAAYIIFFFPDPLFLSVLSSQAVVILWKHRTDLQKKPAIIPIWLRKVSNQG